MVLHYSAEKHYLGQLFVSPDGETEAKQNAYAYVDDSNMSVNEEGVKRFNKENSKNWSLVKASWEDLSGYEKYLFASGGEWQWRNANNTGSDQKE